MPETNFFWDPLSDNILQERDETGAVTVEYTTEPGLYGNLISQNRQGVESQPHFDALGSTLALTDNVQQLADNYGYSAFGEVTERIGITGNPLQYVGRQGYRYDSVAGSYYVRVRQYGPEHARWLSADPLGPFVAINRYGFDRQNPLKYVDYSGLEEIDQDRCSCEDFTTSLGGPITITPDPFFKKPQFEVCSLEVECRDDCDGYPGKAYPPNEGGFITICLSNKARHRTTLNIIYQHELEHARQLCGGDVLRTCTSCITWETKAHQLSCAMAFPKDVARQSDCVNCGVYLSCKAKCKGQPRAPMKPMTHCDSWADVGVTLPEFPFPGD